MVAELTNIKDYVLAEIGKIETDVSFLSELDTYLERMIAPVEGALNKGNFQLKAGRQLLCSIGIDIKSGLVPADHYLLIFKATNFSSYSKEARKLFFECVNDNKYFFRDSERKLTTNFCVVVFPIKDRDYYIDAHLTGIHSISTIDFMVNELVNYSKSNTIQLKSKVLDKRNDMRYFWTAPEPDIQAIISSSAAPAKDIADKLGLSHFDFKTDETKYFCYFNIGCPVVETYRPNATLVNWDGAEVGFLSYYRADKDEAGRTFSISGYSNYTTGVKERIFNKHTLTDDEQLKTNISVLDDKIPAPITIEPIEIILEGIQRFDLA